QRFRRGDVHDIGIVLLQRTSQLLTPPFQQVVSFNSLESAGDGKRQRVEVVDPFVIVEMMAGGVDFKRMLLAVGILLETVQEASDAVLHFVAERACNQRNPRQHESSTLANFAEQHLLRAKLIEQALLAAAVHRRCYYSLLIYRTNEL